MRDIPLVARAPRGKGPRTKKQMRRRRASLQGIRRIQIEQRRESIKGGWGKE